MSHTVRLRRFITKGEFAARLSISPQTLRRRIEEMERVSEKCYKRLDSRTVSDFFEYYQLSYTVIEDIADVGERQASSPTKH